MCLKFGFLGDCHFHFRFEVKHAHEDRIIKFSGNANSIFPESYAGVAPLTKKSEDSRYEIVSI